MRRIPRFWVFLSIAMLVIGFATPLFLLFFGPEKADFGKSLSELFEEEPIGIIVVPLVLIITIISLAPLFRSLIPPSIKDGVEAQAKILEVHDTGTTINDDPLVKLILEFELPTRATIQAESKTIISRLSVAKVVPGVTAKIVYSASDPKKLNIISIEANDSPEDSAESRLEKLERLRDKGLISRDEYLQKREEIIKAI